MPCPAATGWRSCGKSARSGYNCRCWCCPPIPKTVRAALPASWRRGYLNKSVDPDTLAGAIRKLHSGGSYVSAALAESLATALRRHDQRAAHDALSAREYQVFLHIAAGRSAAQIASQLNLSPNTVSTYRTRIMDKIGTRNDVETALYAVRHQIVSGSAEPVS